MSKALVNDVANLLEQCLNKDKEIERLNKRIEELQKENDLDCNLNKSLLKDIDKSGKEIERLNNIINELEKEISKHIALCTDITLNDVLDILKELKGSDTGENLK